LSSFISQQIREDREEKRDRQGEEERGEQCEEERDRTEGKEMNGQQEE